MSNSYKINTATTEDEKLLDLTEEIYFRTGKVITVDQLKKKREIIEAEKARLASKLKTVLADTDEV